MKQCVRQDVRDTFMDILTLREMLMKFYFHHGFRFDE